MAAKLPSAEGWHKTQHVTMKALERLTWQKQEVINLPTDKPIWRHFFTVHPLVVIGTKEGDHYNLAPKHMVTPLGQENYFGFVCTPDHATYHNVKREKAFTVSFPKPNHVTLTSLAASPRCGEQESNKFIVAQLPTLPALDIDAPFLQDSYLYLECKMDRIVDGFGKYSLIGGQIQRAYVDQDYLKFSDSDEQRLLEEQPILAFLAYGRFAVIRESYQFPLPKDFEHLHE